MNAKEELLETLKKCDKTLEDIVAYSAGFINNLYEFNYLRDKDPEKLLLLLDKEYDGGYGIQELEGVILFSDYTWLSRGEYDGSEWWDYNKPPTKEEILNKKD